MCYARFVETQSHRDRAGCVALRAAASGSSRVGFAARSAWRRHKLQPVLEGNVTGVAASMRIAPGFPGSKVSDPLALTRKANVRRLSPCRSVPVGSYPVAATF